MTSEPDCDTSPSLCELSVHKSDRFLGRLGTQLIVKQRQLYHHMNRKRAMKNLSSLGLVSALFLAVTDCETIPVQAADAHPSSVGGSPVSLRRTLYEEAELWKINDPYFDFNKDTSQFLLEWNLTDFIQDKFVSATIYDGYGCKEESVDITDKVSQWYSDNAILPSFGPRADSSTPYDPNNNQGDGERTFRLYLDLQPAWATNTLEYFRDSEDQLRARFDFCVRFSLSNVDESNPDAGNEANFQETLVTFLADLTDGFSVDDIAVKPKKKLEKDAEIDCEIIAYECERYTNKRLENPGYLRNQGKEVRVCVELAQESKDIGLMLDRITWFKWEMANAVQGTLRQNAIIFDSKEALNGLTEYECLRGVDICPFNTILDARFYYTADVDYVLGIGEGICRFGARSTLVEDVWKTVGGDILGWMHHEVNEDGPGPLVTNITFFDFPIGASVSYTSPSGTFVSTTVESEDFNIPFVGDEQTIRAAMDTISLKAPLNSDVDFNLAYKVFTASDTDHTFAHPVVVLAVADPPMITVFNDFLRVEENGDPALMGLTTEKSEDVDNSEYLSVEITIPSDVDGPVGSIVPMSRPANIGFQSLGDGRYRITSSGQDPTTRETFLNSFVENQVFFEPRPYWAGVLASNENATGGIRVDAISTEQFDVAPNDSEEAGTLGDMDTRTERRTTYVDLTVVPVNDLPYLKNATSRVEENKRNSEFDEELVVPIGALMGMTVDDTDGSQSLTAALTGFPTNAINLFVDEATIDPTVAVTVNKAAGTIVVEGVDSNKVLEVIGTITIVLAHDDDKNFQVEISGYSEDSNGYVTVGGDYQLTHFVQVASVADTPTLLVGAEFKEFAAEGATMVPYPVTIALNDTDGSEAYQGQKIDMIITTPMSPAPGAIQAEPAQVSFTNSDGVTFDDSTRYHMVLNGDIANLEAALASLNLAPGKDNGENITVQVTVTSQEANPSETGIGEIAVETQTVVKSFVIPVEAAINGEPNITIPNTVVNGTEDNKFELGDIQVSLIGIEDSDKSEVYYIEIDRSGFGNDVQFDKTRFWVGSKEVKGADRVVLSDGWLRLANITGNPETIFIKPPQHFSGTMNFTVRGAIVDFSNWKNAIKTSASQPLLVNVIPVADSINIPAKTTGVEDNGPIAFGQTLSGANLKDNASNNQIRRQGNNPEPEVISKVDLKFPANTNLVTYTVGYSIPDGGTASIAFDEVNRVYTITSSLLTGVDIPAIPSDTRVQAGNDILNSLATFDVQMGPAHTDENGEIEVSMTTLDVNLGVYDKSIETITHEIVVLAVADTPSIFTHSSEAVDEDAGSIPLFVNATHSQDNDDSEVLSIKITVPTQNGLPIGTITGPPPPGVTITSLEEKTKFIIEASGDTWESRQDLLNSFVSTGNMIFQPRSNWAGNQTLQVDLISTESAEAGGIADAQYGGPDGDSKTETATSYIAIVVNPTADVPDLQVKGAATGYEDKNITVPMSVTLTDTDGSESYITEIDANSVPEGSIIYGNERAITVSNGVYRLMPADVENLYFQAPMHYSTIHQGNITLNTTTFVTDETMLGSSTLSFDLSIPVTVIGVADKPNSADIKVIANEDEDYPLGLAVSNILQSTDVLVDTDGSETLTFVLGGLNAGVALTSSQPDGLNYIGKGEWEVDGTALGTLIVSPALHYSGENPFADLTLRAVSQEKDGDQISSLDWPVLFEILPVADGFSAWNLKVNLTEKDNEVDNVGIFLGNVGEYKLKDDDGSEEVIEFRFDLSSLIGKAGLQICLNNLTEKQATLDDLVNTYIQGTYTFDQPSGVLTVAHQNVGSIRLGAELFKDSNQDFSIPVEALVRDTAIINGQMVASEKVVKGDYEIGICGTADVPTVYAENISGNRKIPINLGGKTTDTDVQLGRPQSETIYYIVKSIDLGILPGFRFIDSNDNLVGFDGGNDGSSLTWILPYEDVEMAKGNGGLFFAVPRQQNAGRRLDQIETDATPVPTLDPTPAPTADPTMAPTSLPTNSPSNSPSIAPSASPSNSPSIAPSASPTRAPATFTITSVAVENDHCQDSATNKTSFTVDYWVGSGPGYEEVIPPLPPIVDIGPNIGQEDSSLVLDIDARKDERDTTDPTISIVFSNVPSGFEIAGKYYMNTETGNNVALASSVKNGNVWLDPPEDFGGYTSITIESIAVNSYFLRASAGEMKVTPYYDPVADGPVITIPGIESGGDENGVVALPISLSVQNPEPMASEDADESEVVGEYAYVQICSKATLSPAGYDIVAGTDVDSMIDGISVESFFRVPVEDISSLSMTPNAYWHGQCDVTVVAYSYETDDDQDSDYLKARSVTFKPKIVSVPTPPSVVAPGSISGDEDTYIAIPGLSAALVDTIDDNGYESLSVVMNDVPKGSLFNFGANTGEGTWSLPVADLAKLEIKPPPQYAGSFTMKFQGIAFDHETSTDAITSSDIAVTVAPIADGFDIVAKNLEAVAGETRMLDLNLLLYDKEGVRQGELPPEIITIDFQNVPLNMTLTAPLGGQLSLTNAALGSWRFVGSENEANSISATIAQGMAYGEFNISLSCFTTDDSSVLPTPVLDSFLLYVVDIASQDVAQESSRLLTFYNHDRRLEEESAALDELAALEFLVDPGTCGSESFIVWESEQGAFPIGVNEISIDAQDHTSVTYTLPSFDPSAVNWAAIILPEDPKGQTTCRVPTQNGATSFRGNCFNGESTFFLLASLNTGSGGGPSSFDGRVPSICDVPKVDYGGAKTIMVEVSVPCSACENEASLAAIDERSNTPDDRGRRMAELLDLPVPMADKKSSHMHRVARSLSSNQPDKNRNLQALEAAAVFEMEITIVGTRQASSASVASFAAVAVSFTIFVSSSVLL